MNNTLPGNADRYTVMGNQPADALPDLIDACNLLGLLWFARKDELTATRVNFYIFLDKQGMVNYLTGLYAPSED